MKARLKSYLIRDRIALFSILAVVILGSGATYAQDESYHPCGQSRFERESLISEAQRKQFNVRRMEVTGNPHIRHREFTNRFTLNEGDIFSRGALVKTVKNVSRIRAIYPIGLEHVEIRLDRKHRDIDMIFCVKERPRQNTK